MPTLDKFQMVAKWEEHCKQVGHVTQAEALGQGHRPNTRKYATYDLSLSGKVIYCGLRECDWSFRSE